MIPLLIPIGGWLAKSALMQSPIGRFLKAIPGKVWLFIAIAAVLAGAVVWHQHMAHKALLKADATGYARAKDEDRKALAKAHREALAWKQQKDAAFAKIAQLERKRNDEEAARIDATAANLLQHGPGKARCGPSNYPGSAAAAGAAARPGEAAPPVVRVSDPERVDLFALPFSPAIASAKQCDLNALDNASWWRWYDALVAAWPKAGDKGP